MNEAAKLARLARYALYRSRDGGQRAEAWRKAFHLILQVLHGVLTGEIPLERLAVLRGILERYAQDGRLDGGAGSGNWGHAGRPGKRGGSARGGGVHNRMTAEGGGFTSFAKIKKALSKEHVATADDFKMACQDGTKVIHEGYAFVYSSEKKGFIDVGGPRNPPYYPEDFVGERVKILLANKNSPNAGKVKDGAKGELSIKEAKKRFDTAFNPVSDKEADAAYREQSGKVWSGASEAEKEALYNYTGHGYMKINHALRSNDTGSDYTNDQIKDITNAISRSKLDTDCVFYRGSGRYGFEKMMKMKKGELTPENVQNLVGQKGIEEGFMSTGSCMGKGFTGMPVNLEILAPKGTQALYVEPFSKHGEGSGLNWDSKNRTDGKSSQYSFSGEQETIIQRSSTLKIISAECRDGQYHFQAMITKQEPKNFGQD